METATELAEVRSHRGAFTWGRVLQIHEVGPYAIVEYDDEAHPGSLHFHIYVDGRDTSHSAPSLDAALAAAIAYRREGANSRAAMYFMRMLAEPERRAHA